MIPVVYVFSILFGVCFLVLVIELVRKNKLLVKYSLLWIFFGILLLILSSTPLVIEEIADLVGIDYAPSVLFLFGVVFLVIYSLNITVVFSRHSERITRLNQEIAILKERLNHMEKKEN